MSPCIIYFVSCSLLFLFVYFLLLFILFKISSAATRPVAAAVTIFPALPAPSPIKYILSSFNLNLLSVSISLLKNFISGPYSSVSSLALLVLAPTIANTIIGDVKGGNTVEDITYVLRISASAILFVTMLSGVRGYLQGHKYITPSSISQVIEQLVRVIIIIFGSYIAVKLFGTKEAVGVAIFGATAGAIVALIYLELKMRKQLKSEENIKV